jgi:hypothetical protein
MPRCTSHFFRGFRIVTAISVFVLTSIGHAALRPFEATQKARTFLVNLFDRDLGLLPEYQGATVYWLFHDNYLAAKVLEVSHPEIAQSIRRAMAREGASKSGKIEILFGEADQPLPFRQFQLKDVRRRGAKVIRTEVATATKLDGWAQYADLLLLACIAESNQARAWRHWEAAMELWDGNGFLDAATKRHQCYSTYKLGLALLAASHLSPPAQPPVGLLERLLALQDDSGGWITDYNAAAQKIGVANVETTCLSILGLDAFARRKAAPQHGDPCRSVGNGEQTSLSCNRGGGGLREENGSS